MKVTFVTLPSGAVYVRTTGESEEGEYLFVRVRESPDRDESWRMTETEVGLAGSVWRDVEVEVEVP